MQTKIPFRKYWMIVVMSISLAIGLNIILLGFHIAKYSKAYQDAAKVLYAPSFPVQIMLYGILIPIIEEILFRGIVFKWMRHKLSFVWSMLVSAALFGLYHGNLVQFVYAGLLGLSLAWFYEKYGTILAPMLSHIVMNVSVSSLVKVNGFAWIMESSVRMAIITMICVILVGVMSVLIQKMDVTKLLKIYCKDTDDVI